MYACVYVYVCVCMRVYLCEFSCADVYGCAPLCMFVNVRVCLCMNVYVWMYVNVCV